ncbi:unnamed protein product [Parajaminaea phylloscopi]
MTSSACLCTPSKFSATTGQSPSHYEVLGQTYRRDDYSNIPSSLLARLPPRPVLPYQHDHPLELLRCQIESHLSSCEALQAPSAVVSCQLNFDDLGISPDHPGRNPTDTYYLNRETCLRTHSSAHEVDIFSQGKDRWLLSADVYRRDEIDSSHYPIFHQMEGASIFAIEDFRAGGLVEAECEAMEAKLREAKIEIEDVVSVEEAGGWQDTHESDPARKRAAELSVRHLKATLNGLVLELFGERHAQDIAGSAAEGASAATGEGAPHDPLRVRWISATFPFTSPSYEVEVWFRGQWLEILGSGVVKQRTLDNASARALETSGPGSAGVGQKDKIGWAFGLGLERIAMILFSIPDIRLFWSTDRRFLQQFASSSPRTPATNASSLSAPPPPGSLPGPEAGVSAAGGRRRRPLITFKPYSRFPPCYKDVSFWLPTDGREFHENDLMELVREVAADLVEDVKLIDAFAHPKTGRQSKCYRINYRSMERSLENEETNVLHSDVVKRLVNELGITVR